MSELLIVKNITREGPGLLMGVLEEAKLGATVVDLSMNEPFPDPLQFQALVVLGGPDSANDQTPKMQDELVKVAVALENGLPFLGICLGMQVAVRAAGGRVLRAPQKEVGFLDITGQQNTVELTDIGKSDPLLEGLEDSLPVFHLHGETVELTDRMQLLGTGKYCTNQIVKINDSAYGIQSHFELTDTMLLEWAEVDPDLQPIGKEALLASYRSIHTAYNHVGKTYLRNFLKVAGLVQ